MNISQSDIIIIFVYLTGITLLGAKLSGDQKTGDSYFLGNRNLPWWTVCLSIVATETSTLTFISIPGLAYISNLNFLQLAMGYILGRTFIVFFFLPSYFRGELSTAYQHLYQKFGLRVRIFSSFLFHITRLLADGVRLFATAIPLSILTGWSMAFCIILLTLFTITYTLIGGLRSVVWIDVFQSFIYIGGALFIVFYICHSFDWLSFLASDTIINKLDVFYTGSELNISTFFQTNYTLAASLIGGAFLSMASHGTDHIIVQRLLSCKNLASSQKALFFSGIIVFFQFGLFLFLGVLLFGYYTGKTMLPDEILPTFIIQELPNGLSGFIVASIFAAAMSTLSSTMNSLASSTLYDFYKPKWGKNLDVKKELKLSRLLTLFWGIILILCAMLFRDKNSPVVELGLSIASFTYGSILGSFFLAQFNKQVKETSVLVAIWATIFMMSWVIGLKGFVVYIIVGACLGIAFWIFSIKIHAVHKIFILLWTIVLIGLHLFIRSPSLAWTWYVPIGTLLCYMIGSVLAGCHLEE